MALTQRTMAFWTLLCLLAAAAAAAAAPQFTSGNAADNLTTAGITAAPVNVFVTPEASKYTSMLITDAGAPAASSANDAPPTSASNAPGAAVAYNAPSPVADTAAPIAVLTAGSSAPPRNSSSVSGRSVSASTPTTTRTTSSAAAFSAIATATIAATQAASSRAPSTPLATAATYSSASPRLTTVASAPPTTHAMSNATAATLSARSSGATAATSTVPLATAAPYSSASPRLTTAAPAPATTFAMSNATTATTARSSSSSATAPPYNYTTSAAAATTATDVGAVLADLAAQLREYKALAGALNQSLVALQQRYEQLEVAAQLNISALRNELRATTAASRNVTANLARQVSVQQLFVEERVRSDGHSGLKRVRGSQDGTKTYYQNKLSSASTVLSSHDHSNYDNTPGLGEFIAVMNGVEFRTRHNDYKLVMPSLTSKVYQATQPIPFPTVPPQVTAKATLREQLAEMREWFKAWRDQNYTVRDYRPFFKPVLCYLEGAWTQSATKIDEPFSSERHAIDAQSWLELTDKIDFTSYTGRKNINENYAFLPTRIVETVNNTPVYAQWNYRILCHPLSFDLPLKAMQVVDELSVRLKFSLRYDQLAASKLARFRLGPDVNWDGRNRDLSYNSLVEKMMREIPGADNYQANITDDVLYNVALTPGSSSQTLNAGYYHRWSSLQKQDAMGLSLTRAGFNDENLFVALTTQTKVVQKKVYDCFNSTKCDTFGQRVTYALPLEVIYLTPLQSWNPYNLSVNPTATVTKGGRDGSLSNPYNGTNPSAYHYLTPTEFFSGGEINKNPADTNLGAVSVLANNRSAYNVTASGVRIFFPNIPGVGVLRQRYFVFPVHEEGSYPFTEIEAVKDALMDQTTYQPLYRQIRNNSSPPSSGGLTGVTLVTSVAPVPRPHEHTIDLTAAERDLLLQGGTVEKVSSIAEGHNHVIVVGRTSGGNATTLASYVMVSCNGAPACGDGHNALRVNSN